MIKTLQWNIGGGLIRLPNSDPVDSASYNQDGFNHIVNLIKKNQPDIITLQEIHGRPHKSQAKDLADAIGLNYCVYDYYDHSHLIKDNELGQAIISRFPITNHNFNFFKNPKYELITPSGEKWISHNKGVTSVLIEPPQMAPLSVMTLHLIPFRKFDINPLSSEAQPLRDDIQAKLKNDHSPSLIQGDFNYNEDSLQVFLPDIFKQGYLEVMNSKPTTVKDRRYDRSLYKGMTHRSTTVITDVLTDHYPVMLEFSL